MDTSTDSQDQASTSTTTSTNGQNSLGDTFTNEQPCEQNTDSALIAMQKSLSLPNSSWTDVSQPLTSVCLCKVSAFPTVSTQPIVITYYLTISENCMYAIVEFNPKFARHYDWYLNSLNLILSITFFNYLIAFMCVVVSQIPILFLWST